MIEVLRKLNPQLRFYGIEDDAFQIYGRVLRGFSTHAICNYLIEETPLPQTDKPRNLYVPSSEGLEQHQDLMDFLSAVYGSMDVQAGFCNGYNSCLNALEYHKSSEVGIAASDLVLLLGHSRDIYSLAYDASKLEAFFVPKGTCFELFAGTLHFAPCKVADSGFKCLIALPRGTNTSLKEAPFNDADTETKLLFKRNKWLIAHAEAAEQLSNGAFCGIVGTNYMIEYK